MLDELKFYKHFFDIPLQEVTDLKTTELKEIIRNDKIYKFILFDGNSDLNNIKIQSLKKDELWFSHYIYLNDSSEFEIKYNIKKVSNKLNKSKDNISEIIDTFKEIYDVCSFSYCNDAEMWNNYANQGNGICLVFEVKDYDKLFPVDYIDKWKIDYNKIIINSFKDKNANQSMMKMNPLAILPYVTKNPMNGHLSSEDEKEVRILYSPYDEGKFNDGRIYPGVKKQLGYRGCNVSYEFCNLKLDGILIGNKCSSDIKEKIKAIANDKKIELHEAVVNTP